MKKARLMLPLMLTVSTLAGCWGKVVEKFDPNKTQIKVNFFNGGYGVEWFMDLKEKFNSKSTKFQIIDDAEKREIVDITNDIRTGNPKDDIYIAYGVNFQDAIYRDLLEDLSDVLEMKPDGESGKTIREKMVDFDLWKSLASKHGNGIYILPHTQSLMGMVFDYQLFVDNNWLKAADSTDEEELTRQGIQFSKQSGKYKFVSSTSKTNYKSGDRILKAGKDGLFGTYDDGQPTTMDEFDALINQITGTNSSYSFIYSGKAENYVNEFYASFIGQYIGAEDYRTLFDYNSKNTEIKMHNSTSKKITLENGYEIFKSEAVYQGLNFIEKYLASSKVDPRVLSYYSYSHTDAQRDYIKDSQKDSKVPAFLIEGTWWENEAKFTGGYDSVPADWNYGKRDYRYLITPSMEGQKTASNKSCMGGMEYQGIIVPKQNDPEKLQAIKEFLGMMNSDENLINFTKKTGCKKYFKYDVPTDVYNSLTPFARNNIEIMSDSEHIDVLPSRLYQASNPLTFATSSYINDCFVPLYRETRTTNVLYPVRYFRDEVDVDELYSTKSHWLGYSSSEWSQMLADVRSQGFFN